MKLRLLISLAMMCASILLHGQSINVNNCATTTAQIDLDINNVRARILVGGDLWWDPVGQAPYYEVPKGSGKNAIYAGSFWIGGFDPSNQLHTAAQTYRQSSSNDYWGGPLSVSNPGGAVNISQARCSDFNRHWKLTKSEVLSFTQGGIATPDIQQWPGNGDVSAGELPYLAPFFDANNDGSYDYLNGDYPFFNFSGNFPIDPVTQQPVCNDYLFGDQCIWWVFNDVGNVKTETNSLPIGIEVRAQAFAYSSSNNALNNSTFYKYQIINRSSNRYDSTYVGIWCDADLGNAGDDYVGCDVSLGLGYVYNGDPLDEGGAGYGLNPPAVGIDFFQGPLADSNDNIDNDRDGLTDELGETIIMSNFTFYQNTNSQPVGNPNTADDYYEYLSGSWLDGVKITYGGDGRGNGPGATTTPSNFMFPGSTDPQFSSPWTMSSAGLLPDDMRWLQSAGAFTMLPGSVNYVTTGVIFARDTTGATGSLTLLQQADAFIQTMFDNCFNTTSISENADIQGIQIRQNPFVNHCVVDLRSVTYDKLDLSIYSLNGKLIESRTVSKAAQLLIGDGYPSGAYVINFRNGNKSYSSKIIKL